jgi:hypothetical protein
MQYGCIYGACDLMTNRYGLQFGLGLTPTYCAGSVTRSPVVQPGMVTAAPCLAMVYASKIVPYDRGRLSYLQSGRGGVGGGYVCVRFW